MILVPRLSGDEEDPQTGGRWMDDSMERFWKRRMLVDELANAPHVDRMMKIMDDMTQSKGRALPPSDTPIRPIVGRTEKTMTRHDVKRR